MKFINKKKLLIATVTGVVLVSISVLSLFGDKNNSVSSVGIEPVSWVNRILSKPAEIVKNIMSSINGLLNTYQENEQLKPHVNTLFSIQAQNEQLKLENQKLKEQLKLKDTLSSYSVVSAVVINRSPDNWLEQIVINVGSNDGVAENMAVISSKGIIGKISSVSLNSSKVILLSNTSFEAMSLSAVIQADGQAIFGIVSKFDSLNKKMIMKNIDLNANIQPNQKVVTSGLSEMTPKGLAIGTVESVEYDSTGLFKQATIIPEGNFNDVQYLFVVVGKNGGN